METLDRHGRSRSHRRIGRYTLLIGALLLLAWPLSPMTFTHVAAATLTVTVSTDTTTGVAANCPGASCSLRDAIAAAGPGDTIMFAPSLNGQTITLANGTLTLTRNVTISGPGAANLTVDGGCTTNCGTSNATGGVPVFIVNNTVTNATISGLTIQRATPDFNVGLEGGGITNSGTLTVANTTLSGNTGGFGAGGITGGGGITNLGTMTVTGSTISGNSPSGSSLGGIENHGTMTVTGSIISGNNGSGIHNDSGMLTVANSTISSNSFEGIASVNTFSNGNSSTLTVMNSTISGNNSFGIENGDKNTATVTGSAISGNLGFAGATGGIVNDNGGTMTVMGGTISGNTGGGIGNGGTMTVTGSTLSGNTGSGINNGGTLTVTGSTISGNSTGGGISGGGIFSSTSLTVTNSTISGNSAGGSGGGISFQSVGTLTVTGSIIGGPTAADGNTSFNNGGGIDFEDNGSGNTLMLNGVTVSHNTANAPLEGGGGLYIAQGTSQTASITNSMITNNTASDTTGNGDGDGGGILIASLGATTITNSTISGNTAFDTLDGGEGGGIQSRAGTVNLINSTVSGNSAIGANGSKGGGINNREQMTVTNSTIVGNTTTSGGTQGIGGGFFNKTGGVLQLTYTTVARNTASTDGGGVHNEGALQSLGTIVAANTGGDCSVVAPGAITSQGYNLDDDGSCALTMPTDRSSDANPGLAAALAANGSTGPQTLALIAGSDAIDRGGTSANGCPATDERGITRPQGAACDIGAFEAVITGVGAATQFAVAGFPSPITAGTPGTFTVTAKDASGNTETGYTGTVHFTSSDPQATLPANYTFTSADAGAHTFTATLKTAGTQSITATDTVTATITGTQSGIQVTAATTASLTITPANGGNSAVKVGGTLQLKVIYTAPNGTPQDVTTQAQWQSQNPQIAVVDARGKVTGESPGPATITATYNGATGQIAVTVLAPTPIGITVQPAPAARPSGTTSQPGPAPAPAPVPRGR